MTPHYIVREATNMDFSTLPTETGAVILLTGVTGFLGKVVLEELFRRQETLQFQKVVLLIRPKKGRHHHARFYEDIRPSLCFSQLPIEWVQQVDVVQSDLREPRCGIDDLVYQQLTASVTHIIHCAGSVKFNQPILDAATSNISSSLNVLQLAKDCHDLRRLIHTSTAYVMPHTNGPIEELLPPLPQPAAELYDGIQSTKLREKELLELTKQPNTYTLTKAIAEHLMVERKGHVALTIVRPSIISASWQFPFPGWIDSHAAFAGFVCAVGGGVMHVIAGDATTLLDIVPVDEVSRLIIDETLLPQKHETEAPIRYAVAGLNHSSYLGSTASMVVGFFKRMALGRRPSVSYIGSRNSIFRLYEFVQQVLPTKLAAAWLAIRGDREKSRSLQSLGRKLSDINSVFAYFTHNTFDFRPSVPILRGFNSYLYVQIVCYGALKHLMKHDGPRMPSVNFLEDIGVASQKSDEGVHQRL